MEFKEPLALSKKMLCKIGEAQCIYASADGILWGGRGHHCDPHHQSPYGRQQPDMHRGNALAVNELM